jgi:hypothetical protein
MSDPYIRDYSYEEVQAMTDTALIKKLIDESYTEEEDIEDLIHEAEKQVKQAEYEVSRQRRKWDRLGEVRFMLESRCKALGADPHEGHYA